MKNGCYCFEIWFKEDGEICKKPLAFQLQVTTTMDVWEAWKYVLDYELNVWGPDLVTITYKGFEF